MTSIAASAVHGPLADREAFAPRMADVYFAAWALVLPITSVLVLPRIQGTTPAYLFALVLLLPLVNILVLGREASLRFYRSLLVIGAAFVAMNACAQLSLSLSDIQYISGIRLVDPNDPQVLLRGTLFTQSLYLLAAGVTFLFVREAYRPSWDKFFLGGAVLLALYGIYEVAFFLAMGRPGDFISNRWFGTGEVQGSFFQTISLGGVVVQRLKSLTGEPSMYAFSMLPMWIYALHTGRRWVALLLLLTLLMSTSTTAVVGIFVYLILRLVLCSGRDTYGVIALILVGVLAVLGLYGEPVVLEIYDKVLAQKLSAGDASGYIRLAGFTSSLDYFAGLPLANQVFGIGFGYIRSNDLFSTLLVNMGLAGIVVTMAMFLYPVFKLGDSERERGLKAALIVTLLAMMVSVPEFSYLPGWLMLGLAYQAIRERSHA